MKAKLAIIILLMVSLAGCVQPPSKRKVEFLHTDVGVSVIDLWDEP